MGQQSKTIKILEKLRALQKEAEQYQNDFGGDITVDDFTNTIVAYCDEIREVLFNEKVQS